jgi:tRNA (guanine-N7-)-methyltransferase
MPKLIYRQFPLEYRKTQPLQFYPEAVDRIHADVLEIGPGRGDFLFQSAEANPNVRFAAVEIGSTRYKKLASRIEKRGLQNVMVVHGDARVIIPKFIPSQSLKQIYVLFPDPWPKNRHVHNRLLKQEVLQLLVDKLADNGTLFVASDVRGYVEWVVGNAAGIRELVHSNPDSPNTCPIAVYQPTYFEQKWRSKGLEIWYAAFHKTAGLTVNETIDK